MKVSINSPIIDEAYGGGMSFVIQLHKYLKLCGIKTINHLDDDDIDIILHVNVTYTYSYNFYKALLYKKHHPKTIIIHRVNDSGYQRKSGLMTHLMTQCSSSSDHVVYNSSWVQNQMKPKLKLPISSSVILNGIDIEPNFSPKNNWDGKSKLKIVTHHWSHNYEKGHDYYQALDQLLDYDDFKDKYEFTYIGNYPKNLEYRNTKLLPAMKKNELLKEIRKHHIYFTASKNEAAGYHAIEGISMGLPVLYYSSGGIPEYANKFGLKFTESNFKLQLNKIRQEYFNFLPVVEKANFSGQVMAKKYLDLFEALLKKEKLTSDKYDKPNIFYINSFLLIFRDRSFEIYKRLYSFNSRLIKNKGISNRKRQY